MLQDCNICAYFVLKIRGISRLLLRHESVNFTSFYQRFKAGKICILLVPVFLNCQLLGSDGRAHDELNAKIADEMTAVYQLLNERFLQSTDGSCRVESDVWQCALTTKRSFGATIKIHSLKFTPTPEITPSQALKQLLSSSGSLTMALAEKIAMITCLLAVMGDDVFDKLYEAEIIIGGDLDSSSRYFSSVDEEFLNSKTQGGIGLVRNLGILNSFDIFVEPLRVCIVGVIDGVVFYSGFGSLFDFPKTFEAIIMHLHSNILKLHEMVICSFRSMLEKYINIVLFRKLQASEHSIDPVKPLFANVEVIRADVDKFRGV